MRPSTSLPSRFNPLSSSCSRLPQTGPAAIPQIHPRCRCRPLCMPARVRRTNGCTPLPAKITVGERRSSGPSKPGTASRITSWLGGATRGGGERCQIGPAVRDGALDGRQIIVQRALPQSLCGAGIRLERDHSLSGEQTFHQASRGQTRHAHCGRRAAHDVHERYHALSEDPLGHAGSGDAAPSRVPQASRPGTGCTDLSSITGVRPASGASASTCPTTSSPCR